MNKDGISKVSISLIHSSGCSESTRPETGGPSKYFTLAQKLEKKIMFQLEKISNWFQISNWEKNPVRQTRYFKMENWKNLVQIDRGSVFTKSMQ